MVLYHFWHLVTPPQKGHFLLPPEGTKVTVLEDVFTTGESAIKAAEKLRDAGYVVEKVVAIVDRKEGGVEAMEKAGLNLRSLFTLEDFK